jgi:hypothetical protein
MAFDGLFAFKLAAAVKNPADRRKTLVKAGEWVEGHYNADGSVTIRVRGYVTQDNKIVLPADYFSRVTEGRRLESCNHGPLGECMGCAYEKLMST